MYVVTGMTAVALRFRFPVGRILRVTVSTRGVYMGTPKFEIGKLVIEYSGIHWHDVRVSSLVVRVADDTVIASCSLVSAVESRG